MECGAVTLELSYTVELAIVGLGFAVPVSMRRICYQRIGG